MLIGATHLRLRHGRKSVAIASCAFALIAFGGLATVSGLASYSGWRLAQLLDNPPAPVALKADWGADWPPEDRMKYSLMLAEATFMDWGESVEYFDFRGERLAFVPTDQHRRQREANLAYKRGVKTQALLLLVAGLLCALLPLIAIWLTTTRIAHRIIELEERFEAWHQATRRTA